VRADVQRESNNKQVPWDSSSVTGDFFFVPMVAEELAAPAESVFEESSEQDFATEAWDVVKDSEDPAILEEFIKMFPDTPQRNLAKLKLMTLKSSPSPDLLLDNSLSGEPAKKHLLDTKECAGCNLDKVDLREVDLRGADMRNVSLTKAYLWKANLEGANLEGANLSYSNLELVNLKDANLKKANLQNARLVETKLTRANLRNANISDVQTYKTQFCETIMPDGKIENSSCPQGSYQSYAKPESNGILSGEAAKKKLLETNECVGCDLRGSDLRKVHLYQANLADADLSQSDLRGSIFYASNFSGANLTQANLEEASLRDSDLSNANLSNAELTSAKFQGTILRKANLTGAQLSKARLDIADLRAAILKDTNLLEITFNGADLREANLRGAILKDHWTDYTKFCNTTMPDGSINNDGC